MTVTDTKSEAANEIRYANPSGRSKRPSIPGRKKSGTKTSTMMSVAKKIAPSTPDAAS